METKRNNGLFHRAKKPIVWNARDEYEEEQKGQKQFVCVKCNVIFWADKRRSICSLDCRSGP